MFSTLRNTYNFFCLYANIDKVELKCTLNTPVAAPSSDTPDLLAAPRYNLSGQQVRLGYRGIVIVGGRKVLMK